MRLLAFLAAAVLLAACSRPVSRNITVNPVLAEFIPQDTVFLAGLNAASLRSTPVYEKYVAHLTFSDVDRFAQETGVDPRRDIDEVLACSNSSTVASIIRGRFDVRGLQTRLESKGIQRSSYKNVDVYRNGQSAIAFISNAIAVGGNMTAVRSVIDAHESGHAGIPEALKSLLGVLPASDQIWAVTAGGFTGLHPAVPENSRLADVTQLLQGVQAAAAGIDLSPGMQVRARVDCRSEDDARHVHDAMRGLIGMARLSTPDNQPELLRLYDDIVVTQDKSLVNVSADIPSEQVDRFLSLWLKRAR